MAVELKEIFLKALTNRSELLEKLHSEDTDTYRLFHGVNEGHPGLTVDRYGEQVLVQAFHESLSDEDLAMLTELVLENVPGISHVVYNDRSQRGAKHVSSEELDQASEQELEALTCKELGVTYAVRGKHRGQDPLLFLDMRSGRRWMLEHAQGKSVLNLFAYTCGVGICASVADATESVNVDFALSSLQFGIENAELNKLDDKKISFVHEDVIPVIRQLGGLKVTGRAARKHKFLKLDARQFDIVYMDPPRWAKTPFGAIDLVRDYQTLFKPALLATAEGGQIFCTNHVPKVDLDEWISSIKRCAEKAGRTVRSIEVIEPETDFPSPDGRHPLKMAVLNV